MLVDLHCHILPSIDDGAKDLDISIDMCRIAEQDGIDCIIATPHFIHGAINNNSKIVKQKVEKLNNTLKKKKVNINIYPGCEAFISPELPRLVREKQVCTLNDTQYILIELPMESVPDYTADIIYQLRLDGYTPIIAHPERNTVISETPDVLIDLINRGALTQINSSSINGLFGKGIMETSLLLLKNKMIHLLASDAHTAGGRSPKLSRAMSIIEHEVGYETLQSIIKHNQAVLKGENIEIEEPIILKSINESKFLGNFKKIISGLLNNGN
ncbi:MAG: CpsB/CapC family capsule biosynthesis tyrosine phosphatase [Lutisporaceae bacterium]